MSDKYQLTTTFKLEEKVARINVQCQGTLDVEGVNKMITNILEKTMTWNKKYETVIDISDIKETENSAIKVLLNLDLMLECYDESNMKIVVMILPNWLMQLKPSYIEEHLKKDGMAVSSKDHLEFDCDKIMKNIIL